MEKTHLYNSFVKKSIEPFTPEEETPGPLDPVKTHLPLATRLKALQPSTTVTISTPKTADSPLILAPNVSGGIKTDNPSEVYKIASQLVDFTPEVKTLSVSPPQKTQPESENKTAGFELSNTKIMVGLIIGAIILYFLGRKKGK